MLSPQTTLFWKDGSIAVKDGAVSNWSFDQAFDATQLAMPADGKLDESRPN